MFSCLFHICDVYIPFFPEIKTYNIKTISAKIMLLNPKIPKYIIKAANGVLFAPENIPTPPSSTYFHLYFQLFKYKKKLKYIFIKIILYFNNSFIEIYSYL